MALDPRIERGMAAQLARRRELLEGGEQPLGWKLGFGAPAAMEKLGTQEPLVGFLLRSGLAEPGSSIALSGYVNPCFEAELAIHLTSDVEPGADDEAAAAAIGALGPAFELADVHPPPEQVEPVLASNVFQRRVVLGPPVDGATLAAASARVAFRGDTHQRDELEAPSGPLPRAVRRVADLLGACGERLRAGEVIIAGALVGPLPVVPGDAVDYELRPLGAISIRFED